MLRPGRLKGLLEGLPGYTVAAQYLAALPVYELHLEVRFLARQPLTPVQVSLLECLASGVSGVEGLELLLGIPRSLAREGLAELLASDLIEPSGPDNSAVGCFRLTEVGVDALNESATKLPITSAVRVMYDGLIGRLHAGLRSEAFLNRFETEKRGLHQIPPRWARPEPGDLDRGRLAVVLRELRRLESYRIPEGELLDVVRMRDAELRFRACDVVALDAPDRSHLAFRVLDRGARSVDHETLLESYFKECPEIVPLEQIPPGAAGDTEAIFGVPKELIERATARDEEIATLRLQIAPEESGKELVGDEIADLREHRVTTKEENEALKARLGELEKEREREIEMLEVHEHRPQLEKALKHSRHRVLIVSPWLNARAVDSGLITLIQKALDRGVEIVIGWGMPDEGTQQGRLKDERSLRTVRRLESLAREKRRGRLKLVHFGNTHAKVLIVDDRYAVIGSFNWLSFREDVTRGTRSEQSFLVRRKDVVERSIASFFDQVRLAEGAEEAAP